MLYKSNISQRYFTHGTFEAVRVPALCQRTYDTSGGKLTCEVEDFTLSNVLSYKHTTSSTARSIQRLVIMFTILSVLVLKRKHTSSLNTTFLESNNRSSYFKINPVGKRFKALYTSNDTDAKFIVPAS